MRKLITLLFILATSVATYAQTELKKENQKVVEFTVDSTSVLTLDSTIKTLYSVISGEKEEPRNWKQFKFLFKPDAKLIPSGKDKSGNYKVRYMSPNDYVKNSGQWVVDNGFVEKEISRKVDTYGNISHVFSTYECFYSKADKAPFMRGINSIQLMNDGNRWWIINIYWAQESNEHPIPEKYSK